MNNCSICIDNVPNLMSSDVLKTIFGAYGPIKMLHTERTKIDQKVKIAVVTFQNEEDALQAKSVLHECHPYYFNIRQPEVSRSRCLSVEEGYGSDCSLPGSNATEGTRLTVLPYTCETCGLPGEVVCSVCKIWYCGRVCQDYDWPRHRMKCSPPPPLSKPTTPIRLPAPVKSSNSFFGELTEANTRLKSIEMADNTSGCGDAGEKCVKFVKESKSVTFPEEIKVEEPAPVAQPAAVKIKENRSIDADQCGESVAFFHPDIPEARLRGDTTYTIVTPVENFRHPNDFIVRLKISSACYEAMEKDLELSSQITVPADWKPEKRGVVAASCDGTWRRGIALMKKGSKYTVYLNDVGNRITTELDNLIPLSDKVQKYPACVVQVSLANLGPVDDVWTSAACSVTKSYLNDGQIYIKVIGREESGRLAVEVTKVGEVDLKDKLLMAKFGVPTKVEHCDVPMNLVSYEDSHTLEQKPEPKRETCNITYVKSPEEFYIFPSSKSLVYEDIMGKIQDGQVPVNAPHPGFTCTAKKDGIFYRARIISFSKGIAEVLLIDVGEVEHLPKENLYTLRANLRDIEPMALKVKLDTDSLRRNGSWSKSETELLVKVMGLESDPAFYYSLKDDLVTLTRVDTGVDVLESFIQELGSTESQKNSTGRVEEKVKVAEESKAEPVLQEKAQNRLSKRLNRSDGGGDSPVNAERHSEDIKSNKEDSKDIKMGQSIEEKTPPRTSNSSDGHVQTATKVTVQTAKESEVEDVEPRKEAVVSAQSDNDNIKAEKTTAPVQGSRSRLLEMARQRNSVGKANIQQKEAREEVMKEERPLPKPFVACVSWINSIDEFFMLPVDKEGLFEAYLLETQDPKQKLECVQVGQTCGFMHDGLVYRAKIEKVSPDGKKVKLFFLDEGRVVKGETNEVWKLEAHADDPGLVMKMGLSDIQPVQEGGWTDDAIDFFQLLTGVDDKIVFRVVPKKLDGDKLLVDLIDDNCPEDKVCDMLVSESHAVYQTQNKAREEDKSANDRKNLQDSTPINKEERIQDGKEKDSIEDVIKSEKDVEKEKPKPLPAPFTCRVNLIYSIDDFYITDVNEDIKFEEILVEIQETKDRAENVRTKDVCGLKRNDIWCRVRVDQIEQEFVQVTAIDEGCRYRVQAKDLYKLSHHSLHPDLATQVSLHGVQPTEGDSWPAESIDCFKELISIEDRIKFTATPRSWAGDKLEVELSDLKGDVGNIGATLVEAEIARYK